MKRGIFSFYPILLIVIVLLISVPFEISKQAISKEANPVRNSSGALNPDGIILKCNPAPEQKSIISNGANGEENRGILIQASEREGEQGKSDSPYTQLLKQLKVKVDGWLKSLNERIEREDITRFEVRFLEILRNILEWVKEKIDAKLESSETEKEKMRRPEGEKEGKKEGEEEWISPRDFIERKVEPRR